MKFERLINGILLLDKPSGMTSNQALQRVKRLYQAKKVGHTGSLDPLASGVLPICFGEATKFARFLLEADKQYFVTMRFGIKTDTGDADGKIINQQEPPNFDLATIELALSKFRGASLQVPSMFSAIKHKGQPLYKLARQGITIEVAPRNIFISYIECIAIRDDTADLIVKCSKGTYIRSLVEDLANTLGCFAHVIFLRRQQVGYFSLANAISLDSLELLCNENNQKYKQEYKRELDKLLLPIEQVLPDLPILILSQIEANALYQGKQILPSSVPNGKLVSLITNITNTPKNNTFIGVGRVLDSGHVAVVRLIQRNL